MTIYIAHRGNLNGPNPEMENSPEYINTAIKSGFNVEVDVWSIDNKLYLGHDKPQYLIKTGFLLERHKVLWIHCKNLEAVNALLKFKSLNIFVHDKDMATLTSHNYVWTYPGCKYYPDNSICVMPEWETCDLTTISSLSSSGYIGICTDYPQKLASL